MNDPGPVRFTVRAPATSGNIGAGFDCLALTLDLWNTTTVELTGEGVSVRLEGEFTDHISTDETNLIVHTMLRRLRELRVPRPQGMRITCDNRIPPASGLGSSSSSQALGLMAADLIAGRELDAVDLLKNLAVIEGHADNAAAVALSGALILVAGGDEYIWRSFDVPELLAVVVTPPATYSTSQARALLPQAVPLSDAVFNMGRVPLIIEALRAGDLDMLREVIARQAAPALPAGAHAPALWRPCPAAWEAGAAGAFVSGSGPSLLAFVHDEDEAETHRRGHARGVQGLRGERLDAHRHDEQRGGRHHPEPAGAEVNPAAGRVPPPAARSHRSVGADRPRGAAMSAGYELRRPHRRRRRARLGRLPRSRSSSRPRWPWCRCCTTRPRSGCAKGSRSK